MTSVFADRSVTYAKQPFYCSFLAKCWLAISLCFCLISSAYALDENARFHIIGVEQGLSNEAITQVFKDSRGFIWVGTQGGLNRIDAEGVKHYLPSPRDPHSIKGEWITAISEDRDGNLFVSTQDGINVLDPDTNKFTIFTSGGMPGERLSSPRSVAATKIENGILAFGPRSIDFIRAGQKEVEYIPFQFKERLHGAGYFDGIGTVIITALNDFHIITDKATIRRLAALWTNANGKALPNSFGQAKVMKLDHQNTIWVGTTNGLFKSDIALTEGSETNPITFTQIAPTIGDSITTITIDDKNRIWYGTMRHGVKVISINDMSMVEFRHDSSRKGSLSYNHVHSIIYDDGVVFIGTEKGLNIYTTAHERFTSLTASDIPKKGLLGTHITEFDEYVDGKIFIATTQGLNLYDPKTGLINQYSVDTIANGIQEPSIMSIEVISETEVWLGYRSSGISIFNPVDNTFVHHKATRNEPGTLRSPAIPVIYQSKDGNIWIGTHGRGLHRYDRESDNFEHFAFDQFNTNSLANNFIVSIYEDTNGWLWLGSLENSATIFNVKEGRFERIYLTLHAGFNIGHVSLFSITQDAQNNYWFATGKGLMSLSYNQVMQKDYAYKLFLKEEGLPSNAVYGLIQDGRDIWGSTNNGLIKVNTITKEIQAFTPQHGLIHQEFNTGAFFKASNGQLYFGGPYGVTKFSPNDVTLSQKSPDIRLTAIYRNKDISDVALQDTRKQPIVFNHSDRFIRFEFSTMDLSAMGNVKYMYFMDGFDSDYINLTKENGASYSNMPPGEYVFHVASTNGDGVWVKNQIKQPIVIKPHPWLSVPLKYTYATLVFFLLAYIIYLTCTRISANRLYRIKLEREVDERTKQLQESNLQLHRVNYTDPMTGLKNKRYLLEHIKLLTDQVVRHDKNDRRTSVVYASRARMFYLILDLDDFGCKNLEHGYNAGSNLLKQIGTAITQACRERDIITRGEGDKFVIAGHVKDISELEVLSERLRSKVASTLWNLKTGTNTRITASIGYSCYPICYNNPEKVSKERVFDIADNAVYLSKQAGRNCWTGIVPSSPISNIGALYDVQKDLNEAISLGTLKVVQNKVGTNVNAMQVES